MDQIPTSMVAHTVQGTQAVEDWKKDAFEDINKNVAVHNVVATDSTTPSAPPKKNYKIVMIRHGESLWNKENRFCGWFDAGLSEKGMHTYVLHSLRK